MKQATSMHEKLVKRGLRLHESFRYKSALPLFQKAFELTPTCPAVIYNLANTLHMIDREQVAECLLRRLTKMSVDLTNGSAGPRQPRSFKCDALYLMFHVILSSTSCWSKAIPYAQKHLHNRKRGLKSAGTLREIRKEIAELQNQFSQNGLMIPRRILKKIRQIELRTNRIVTGFAERGCLHLSRVVSHKIILCLALVLGDASIGRSTATRHCCEVQPPQAVAEAAKVKLKLVKVDSEESDGENGHGENAVDGNPDTFWHTQWQGVSPQTPHAIIIELLPPSVIEGFTYLPRQDVSDHGHIEDFEFYVSDDGWSFGQPVKKGTFEPGKRRSAETFVPTKCRFIKLKAISEVNGLPWTSAAEIGVIQSGDAPKATDAADKY